VTQLACFFCGVDSTYLIIFLGVMLGCGTLGVICFMIWGVASGHLRDEDRLSRAALEAEGAAGERSTLNGGGHHIPLPLLLIWVVFFIWMFVYLGTYMVPALPK